MSRAHIRPLGLAVLALAIAPLTISAQAQRGRAAQALLPRRPNSRRPIDLTGYWVSVVTEDWRYRMVTAPKGDHPGLPLNPEGNRVANAWDPAKDEAAGEQCKAYGAAGVMRAPGRLHITWDADDAMKLETEAGTQTRMFRFGGARGSGGSRRGRVRRSPRGKCPAAAEDADAAGRRAAR